MKTEKKGIKSVTKADLKTRKDPYTVETYDKDNETFISVSRTQSSSSVFDDYKL